MKLNEYKEKLEETNYDVFVTDNTSDLINYLKSKNEMVRIYIDESVPVYLAGMGYETIHVDMINTANKKGGFNLKYNYKDPKQICLLYVPFTDELFSEEDDAYYDSYELCYGYDSFDIYSEKDFSKSKLYKDLGKCNLTDLNDVYNESLHEDTSVLKNKILDKLQSMGYNCSYRDEGWYYEDGTEVEDDYWEDDSEPTDDMWYIENSYYHCDNDSNKTSFSWRVDESKKEFTIVGIYGNYEGTVKGFATKTLDEVLSLIPTNWTINIENNINSSYWNHIRDKYPQYNWEEIWESLNEDFEQKEFDEDDDKIIDEDNQYSMLQDTLDNYNIYELLKEVNWYTAKNLSWNIDRKGPQFILPNGAVFTNSDFRTHLDIAGELIYRVWDKWGYNIDEANLYVWDDFLDEFSWNENLIRINPGNSYIEDRFYCVLPDSIPTEEQFQTLLKFLDLGIEMRKDRVLIYVGNIDSKWYSLYSNTPDEIIKNIKRCYSTGILVEKLIDEELEENLSVQQQEFFKDSKVRDKDGNLLVCYHGASNPGFKEFNPKNAKSQFGKYKFGKANVNYFTTDKQSAISYTDLGVERNNNVYACYINIVNPYIVNNETESEIKSAFNIKDKKLRQRQIQLFDKLINKYKWLKLENDDLNRFNDDLLTLNLEARIDDDYLVIYELGNNSKFGFEQPRYSQYLDDELFIDSDEVEEFRDSLIGEEDDYFFTTDDIVRYVLSLDEDYDGIIIEDIFDSKDMFSGIGTDVITLKSSNQIKLINNENPTNSNRIDESLLLEKTRNQLLTKSKTADNYSRNNQAKGKNRYERRKYSRIARSVAQYNEISMDDLFKKDNLQVGIQVQGETNNYIVQLRFEGVIRELAEEVKRNNGKLEFKNIVKAMSKVFNNGDVFINCDCADYRYRQSYWATKQGYSIVPELRPSDITNPNDSKGGGCKHILLVLANLDWVMKISSVINNYIKYCQKNLQNAYATYIFPKVYGMPYQKAVQLSLFDDGLLPDDQETLSKVASQNIKNKKQSNVQKPMPVTKGFNKKEEPVEEPTKQEKPKTSGKSPLSATDKYRYERDKNKEPKFKKQLSIFDVEEEK